MKISHLFFILFILPLSLMAQIVNIPDPVFKQRLIDEGIDTNNDNEIQVAEAEAVTGALDVNGQFDDIFDLTGIEAFVNITELQVWQNQLTSLDLSQNVALKFIYCHDNQLNNLNVSQCTELEILHCFINQLTNLNLTPNNSLTEVLCGNNELTDMDIRNGNNTAITSFSSSNNPNLICIFVDDADYSEVNWTRDPASTFVETQAECDALAVNDFQNKKINIYPNPVQAKLYVSIPFDFFAPNSLLIITDALGKKVHQSTLQVREFEINLSHLQNGIYFLNVKNNRTQLLTKKFIKS